MQLVPVTGKVGEPYAQTRIFGWNIEFLHPKFESASGEDTLNRNGCRHVSVRCYRLTGGALWSAAYSVVRRVYEKKCCFSVQCHLINMSHSVAFSAHTKNQMPHVKQKPKKSICRRFELINFLRCWLGDINHIKKYVFIIVLEFFSIHK